MIVYDSVFHHTMITRKPVVLIFDVKYHFYWKHYSVYDYTVRLLQWLQMENIQVRTKKVSL